MNRKQSLDLIGFSLRYIKYNFIGTVRALKLRLQGYRIINRHFKGWHVLRKVKIERELQLILKKIGVNRLGVIIEHGCAFGTHYTPILKKFADRIIGVDIYEPELVTNLDEYIQVPFDLIPSYFHDIEDESVDAVVIIASVGLHAHQSTSIQKPNWEEYFFDNESRQGRYLTKDNYLRLVKPGGFIIVIEWEGHLDLRFGKLSLKEALTRIDEFYKTPLIPGFIKIYSSLTESLIGPVVVYQKIA